MYLFTARLAKFILRARGKIQVINKELLPTQTGYVIACSHRGWVDVIGLGVSILPVEIHYMAKKELFQNKLVGKFLTSIHAFPVNRENPGTSSIKVPMKLLKEKKVVGIFPSGTRSKDDAPMKRGAVTMAALANVPIVPAAYAGPNNAKELFSRKDITVIIGEPMDIDRKDRDKEILQQKTEELNDIITQLEEKIRN